MRRLTAGLDLPPLEPVPADHVLTKAFYILRDFPGRWTGGKVWVEALPPAPKNGAPPARGGDGVSPVIIGGNDWAAAWAVDASGHFLTDAGRRAAKCQREMAFRFGINLVMYALTGNYKTDQVHAPALLQRLGQVRRMTRLGFRARHCRSTLLVALARRGAADHALRALSCGRAAPGRAAWPLPCCCSPWPGRCWSRRQHAPLPDVAVIVTDRSQSMSIGQPRRAGGSGARRRSSACWRSSPT